jgi:uncharacterized protein YijF (DUF1287 family)
MLLATLILIGCPAKTPRPAQADNKAPRTSEPGHPPTPAAPPAATPVVTPVPTVRPPSTPYAVPLADKGIYPELASKVRLRFPSWLAGAPSALVPTDRARLTYVDGVPVALDRDKTGLPAVKLGAAHDADGDGIPDPLDFLIGGKKAALNNAAYTEGYKRLRYPGGDVPRTIGVCTDVIIRALRNAGLDLQRLVHDDLRRARKAYRNVRKVDTNINHRRVRSILPYFRRHWRELSADRAGKDVPLIPGDLIFMNTLGDERPDHIGIISDRLGRSGYPLVINNWTVGYRTSEMDLLGTVPITHRFRMRSQPLPLAPNQRGLAGVLKRQALTLGARHTQVLLVTTPSWSVSGGQLRRFERRNESWRAVGRPVAIRINGNGLDRGRGLHDAQKGALPGCKVIKKEGDHRSPAGVYTLGTALGPHRRRPFRGQWPWRATDAQDRFVDDPASPHYNTWQRAPTSGAAAWKSAEKLAHYRLALLVEHNTRPVKPGAGSAIFIHTPADGASVGCTTLTKKDLLVILGWLRPDAAPVLVQVADQVL